MRRKYREKNGAGETPLLNAHGDVVPPDEDWTKYPYGGEIANGNIYGRAAAFSKCNFSTYAFAVRALEAVAKPTHGSVELLFAYYSYLQMEVTVHGNMAHAAVPESGIKALQATNKNSDGPLCLEHSVQVNHVKR